MNKPSVSVRNMTKSFSGSRVVDGLSFAVQRGEVFALLGHNGAGKSTAIDLILGLKMPNGGSAKIMGMDAAKNRKQVFERVGVQLQNTRYQANITVEEACIEYASWYAEPADYSQLLERFGLGALRKNFVSRLSGGERQKLSVVLALIGKPEIVFLDKLTTGLDVVARREVWRTLKQLKEQGLTVFLTTHYMEEAEALCDRVCIIKLGTKVAEGTIDEVIAASGQTNLEEAYLFLWERRSCYEAFFEYVSGEQKIFFRSPDVILFCLAMPLVVFVVITMITGEKIPQIRVLHIFRARMCRCPRWGSAAARL